VHHARNPKYLDKNFAAMFIFWDHLFGTFEEETEEPVYGLTHPLETHNVAWARFHVLFEIGDRMRRSASLQEALIAPFRPPGWDPDPSRGHESTQLVPQQHLVTRASPSLRTYALAQHGLLFVAVFAFTYVAPNLDVIARILVGIWLCSSLGIVGALLDAQRWAVPAESARWLVAIAWIAVRVLG
jgi:hypothetical protein